MILDTLENCTLDNQPGMREPFWKFRYPAEKFWHNNGAKNQQTKPLIWDALEWAVSKDRKRQLLLQMQRQQFKTSRNMRKQGNMTSPKDSKNLSVTLKRHGDL